MFAGLHSGKEEEEKRRRGDKFFVHNLEASI
jgi:hypothetical protein